MKRRSLGVARRKTAEISLHSPSQNQSVKLNKPTHKQQCSNVCTTTGTDSNSNTGNRSMECPVGVEDCSVNSHQSKKQHGKDMKEPLRDEVNHRQSTPTSERMCLNTPTPKTFSCRISRDNDDGDDGNDRTKSKPSTQSTEILQNQIKLQHDRAGTSGVAPSDKFSNQSTPIHKRPVSRQSLSGSARKRFRHDDFKSPIRIQQEPKPAETAQSVAKEIESLQKTAKQLDTENASLINEGYREDELQNHIEKMHEYNELKDTGQMLLGKIALVEGVTTKDLYGRFGLSISD